jgi:glutathione synthase/RimK-type ligase-like ATP-grasp enzyme
LIGRHSIQGDLQTLKRKVGGPYRKWGIDRKLPSMPTQAIVPLDDTETVLLLTSRYPPGFQHETYVAELAYANALAEAERAFGVTENPSAVFDKTVIWFIPDKTFVFPRLWDYSRQVYQFALGMESQGNRPLCSADETLFWENKAHMHRRLAEIGAPTPRTEILTAEGWQSSRFDLEPALIKEEHSAGSGGIHHFQTAAEARRFVSEYPFRPTESLIMQEIVPGATKDLRLTMAGDRIVEAATYWRVKNPEVLASPEWTTTATSYNSLVVHGDIPSDIGSLAAKWLQGLGIRTAGVDLMWTDDDVSKDPQILELSPYYQPNPPKPERYADWTYREYKGRRRNIPQGYRLEQFDAYRTIARDLLAQDLI